MICYIQKGVSFGSYKYNINISFSFFREECFEKNFLTVLGCVDLIGKCFVDRIRV